MGQLQLTEPVIRRDHFGTDTDLWSYPAPGVWRYVDVLIVAYAYLRDERGWPWLSRLGRFTANEPSVAQQASRAGVAVADALPHSNSTGFYAKVGDAEAGALLQNRTALAEPEGYEANPCSLANQFRLSDVTPSGIRRCREINKKCWKHAPDGFDRIVVIPDSCSWSRGDLTGSQDLFIV